MKNLLHIFTFSLLAGLAACGSSNDVKPDVVTYELTFTAKKSTTGNTVFTEIVYDDGTGAKTITNRTTDFEQKVTIAAGAKVSFSVKADVTSTTTLPNVQASTQVSKKINGVDNGVICLRSQQSNSLVSGVGKFSGNISFTFSGTGCN